MSRSQRGDRSLTARSRSTAAASAARRGRRVQQARSGRAGVAGRRRVDPAVRAEAALQRAGGLQRVETPLRDRRQPGVDAVGRRVDRGAQPPFDLVERQRGDRAQRVGDEVQLRAGAARGRRVRLESPGRSAAAAGPPGAGRARTAPGRTPSPPERSRTRSPISSWSDRTASRSSRLSPCPPSTLASSVAVLANEVGVDTAASARAPSRPGRSPAATPGGSTSGSPTRRHGPRAP